MRQLSPTELKRLHRTWRRRTEGRLALLLDGVQTPYNVGSILRLAAAWRVEHLWLAGATASPSHPGARKTALGSERYLTWTQVERADQAAAEITGGGWRLVGIELAEAARPLHEVPLEGPVCLALGHEDHGLSAAVLRSCDDVAYVPIVGRVGSLNVATAAAVALYEVRRREWTGG